MSAEHSFADALTVAKREFFIDNLLVRIHFIIVMIRWTGQFEFPFPGSLTSTFLAGHAGMSAEHSFADALTVAHMWEWCTPYPLRPAPSLSLSISLHKH